MDPTIDQIAEQYRALRRTKGIGVAEPYLAKQVEANPSADRLRGLWANALLWRGRLEDAEREANRALETVEGRCSLAEIKVFAGDFDAAGSILQALLDEYPNEPRVLIAAFHVQSVTSDAAATDAVLKRLVEFGGDDPDVYHTRVIGAIHARDIENAQALLDAAPAPYRETYQCVQAKAKLAMSGQNIETAEALHREAVAMAPEADSPWADLAQILSFKGDGEEANNCASYALEINSRNSIALNAQARIAERLGDFQRAEALRKQAMEAVPFLAYTAITQRANDARRKGKPEDSLTILKELEKQPSAFARRLGLDIRLQILVRMDRPKEIEECLVQYSPEQLRSPIAIAGQARLAELNGDSAKALELVDGGLAIAPDFFYLLAIWLDLKQAAGARDEILSQIENWTARMPGLPSTCAQLVHQLDLMGYNEESEKFLAASQRAYPNDQNLEVLAIGKLAEKGDSAQVMRRLGGLTGHHAEVRHRVMSRMMFRLLLSPKFWFWRLFKRKKKK